MAYYGPRPGIYVSSVESITAALLNATGAFSGKTIIIRPPAGGGTHSFTDNLVIGNNVQFVFDSDSSDGEVTLSFAADKGIITASTASQFFADSTVSWSSTKFVLAAGDWSSYITDGTTELWVQGRSYVSTSHTASDFTPTFTPIGAADISAKYYCVTNPTKNVKGSGRVTIYNTSGSTVGVSKLRGLKDSDLENLEIIFTPAATTDAVLCQDFGWLNVKGPKWTLKKWANTYDGGQYLRPFLVGAFQKSLVQQSVDDISRTINSGSARDFYALAIFGGCNIITKVYQAGLTLANAGAGNRTINGIYVSTVDDITHQGTITSLSTSGGAGTSTVRATVHASCTGQSTAGLGTSETIA